MKTTIEYLNEAKEALGIESDYKMAKWLNVSTAAMAQYRGGKRTIDDYTAAKLAQALGLNPLEVIAAANMEREKISERKEFWRKIAQGGIAAGLFLALFSVGYGDGINFLFVGSIHSAQLGARLWRRRQQCLSADGRFHRTDCSSHGASRCGPAARAINSAPTPGISDRQSAYESFSPFVQNHPTVTLLGLPHYARSGIPQCQKTHSNLDSRAPDEVYFNSLPALLKAT